VANPERNEVGYSTTSPGGLYSVAQTPQMNSRLPGGGAL